MYQPDIMVVTDTWLNDSVYTNSIELANYNLFCQDRALGWGGYVYIFLKSIMPLLMCMTMFASRKKLCANYQPQKWPNSSSRCHLSYTSELRRFRCQLMASFPNRNSYFRIAGDLSRPSMLATHSSPHHGSIDCLKQLTPRDGFTVLTFQLDLIIFSIFFYN